MLNTFIVGDCVVFESAQRYHDERSKKGCDSGIIGVRALDPSQKFAQGRSFVCAAGNAFGQLRLDPDLCHFVRARLVRWIEWRESAPGVSHPGHSKNLL